MPAPEARPNRSSPHIKKGTTTKANRASIDTPRKAHNKAHNSHKAGKEERDEEVSIESEDDDMGTTFLQYWSVQDVYPKNIQRDSSSHSAICDRQMIVPHSAQLYCSDSCRHMDTLPASSRLQTLAPVNMPSNTQDEYSKLIDALRSSLQPQRLPAASQSVHKDDMRLPPVVHSGRADIDPTEWKPAEGNSSDGVVIKKHSSPESRPTSGSTSKGSDAFGTQDRGSRGMPSLSSTATASSTSSASPSLPGSPYTLVSPPIVGSSTASIGSASSFGIDGLKPGAEVPVQYGKKTLLSAKRSSAASGSLKKLLEQGK